MRPSSARLRNCTAIVNKIGYPDKWRDYSSIKIVRDDYFGNVDRATVFEIQARAGENREARGSHASGK